MLKQAADTVIKTQIADDNYELVEYLNQLREGILEAYTGIIQGMKADNKVDRTYPALGDVFNFVLHIGSQKQCNESVRKGAVGIVGDMAVAFQGRVKGQVQAPPIQQLITDCLNNPGFSKETKEVAGWAHSVTTKL